MAVLHIVVIVGRFYVLEYSSILNDVPLMEGLRVSDSHLSASETALIGLMLIANSLSALGCIS
jgi:hypothetical protein